MVVGEKGLFVAIAILIDDRQITNRDVDIGHLARANAKELGRCDTGHDKRFAVEQNRSPDGIGAAAELPLPESVRDDDHGGRAGPVVGGIYQPANRWFNAQTGEVSAGDVNAFFEQRLPVHDCIQPSGFGKCKQAREHMIVVAQQLIQVVGVVGAYSVSAVAIRRAGEAVDHTRVARRPPVQQHQLFGMLHGQRAKQDRVHETVNGRIGTDAERQRNHRKSSEQLVRPHGAQSVAQILSELFQKPTGPHAAAPFFPERHVAEWRAGRVSALLLGFHSEMMGDFFVELAVEIRAMQEPMQTPPECLHDIPSGRLNHFANGRNDALKFAHLAA